MSQLIPIPKAEITAFQKLSDECRKHTRARMGAVAAVRAVRAADRRKRGEVTAAAAYAIGMDAKGLQNLCSVYARELKEDPAWAWRVCVDKRKFPEDARRLAGEASSSGIPEGAMRSIRKLLRGAPTAADAWKTFIRQWERWLRGDESARLEGFDKCPPDTGQGYPAGCALRTFERLKKATVPAWENTALRQGLRAVSGHLAQVRSSRAETWVGAIIEWDDMKHDVQVWHGTQIVRAWQFSAIDTHSACIFHHGLKPALTRDDETQMGLNGPDARYFFADMMLRNGGYHAGKGTLVRLENATTNLPDWIIELIESFTGGKLTFERAPLQQKPLMSGWYSGKGGGNPRFKPLIERMHELLHRALWQLPGQTGSSQEQRPEWLEGMNKEADELIKAITGDSGKFPAMCAARAALIQSPHVDFHLHFVPAVREVFHWINSRTDHKLEGWEQYVERLYRFAKSGSQSQWFNGETYARLNPAQRAELQAKLLADTDAHTKLQPLSPLAVWERGRAELSPITDELACLIIACDFEEGLKDGQSLERTPSWGASFVADGMRYESRVRTSEGALVELPHTDKYQVIPFGDRAFIRDLDGRYLGAAALICPVNPLDREQVEQAMGRKAERNAAMLEPLRRDHADDAAAIVKRRAHNRAVIAGEPVTPVEKEERAATENLHAKGVRALLGLGGEAPAED
jgi:hypothetical protein